MGPVKRTSPFSMNTARSARLRATLTDCSTITIVVPRRWISRTTSSSCPTMVGARPSDSSSIMRSSGRVISAPPRASICCSPPERLPAIWLDRSLRIGKSVSTSCLAASTRSRSLRMSQDGQAQVLGHGEGGEHALAAGHQRDAAVGGDVGRRGSVTSSPLNSHRAGLRPHEAADALEERRLAGAVGAEQGDDLAGRHVEVDVEQDLHRAVGHVDAAARQERRRSVPRRGVLGAGQVVEAISTWDR